MYLLLIDKLGVYGAERVAINLANALAVDVPVTVVTYASDNGDIGELLHPNVRRVRINRSNTKAIALVQVVIRLRKLLRSSDARALLSFMPLANSVAACASLGIELRVVGSEHNMPTQTIAKTTLGGVKRLLMAIAYRRLQHVVCVSDDVCRDVERWYRYPPAKLSTIYNPVDFAGMTALSSENSSYVDWRSRNPETYLVLVVGALKAAKNHEFALRVISGMKPCFKMVFVGDGPLQEELTILSGQLDVLDRVEFAGSTANPYGWMKHADVLLVPSLYEGFGLVIVEAAFLGTPVITSDRYGVREISRRAGQTVLPLELDRFRRSIEEVVSMTESIDFNPRAYQPDKVAGIYRRILDGES